jgi:hypothetical protein
VFTEVRFPSQHVVLIETPRGARLSERMRAGECVLTAERLPCCAGQSFELIGKPLSFGDSEPSSYLDFPELQEIRLEDLALYDEKAQPSYRHWP